MMALRSAPVSALPTFTLCASLFVNGCCGCPPIKAAAQSDVAAAARSASVKLSGSAPYRWKNVKLLGGGFVTGVIFNPSEKDLVYARTDIGGAYRYQPADGSWIPLTDHFGPDETNYYGIESLGVDPVEPNRVYMAVGTYTQDWAGPGAIMRSTDRGDTWELQAMPFKMGGNENGRGNGERLAVDPNQNSIVLFGSRKNGLWRSNDHGANWSQDDKFPVATESLGVGITFVLFDKQSGSPGNPTPVIYAGFASTEAGLYRSTDGGASWQAVPGQPKGVMPSHAGLDASGILYLSYGNLPGPSDVTSGAVWKYDAKKNQWTNVTPLAPSADDKFGYGGLSVYEKGSGVVMVTSIDRWTQGDEIWRTTNGGKTWKALAAEAVRDDGGAKYLYWGREKPSSVGWMADIDIDPFNPARALYVTGQGIWGSDDVNQADAGRPTHFSFRNVGLEETAVLDLASPPSGPALFSGVGDLGGFRHDDIDVAPPGGMFQNPLFGNCTGLDFAESKPELLVRVGSHNEGQRGAISMDAGTTWTPFSTQPSGQGAGSIVIAADGSTLVWASKNGPVSWSADQGQSWVVAEGLPEPPALPDWASVNFKLAADRVNPQKFYIYDALAGKAYASEDGARHFAASPTGLPSNPDYKLGSTTARAVPGQDGHVWLATGKELFRSTDSGKTYQPLLGISDSAGVGFGKGAEGQAYPSLYMIGKIDGGSGIYRSDDSGQTWMRINNDRQKFGSANRISGDPRVAGRVYVGTHGRGILYGEPGQ